MDVIEFIRERARMCRFYGCDECPAKDCACDELYEIADDDRIVEIVEGFVASHPHKTRQSVFLALFPDARLDGNGIVDIDSCKMGECGAMLCPRNKSCADCRREFWLHEVE